MRYVWVLLMAASVAEALCPPTNGVSGGTGNAVKHMRWEGLHLSGTYRAVDEIDNSGTCTFKNKDYSGPIAPYDEELSWHMRGPFNLYAFAVYLPSTATKRAAPRISARRHAHRQANKRHVERRADMVTATIDGVVATWENDWAGGATQAPQQDQSPDAASSQSTAPPSTPEPSPQNAGEAEGNKGSGKSCGIHGERNGGDSGGNSSESSGGSSDENSDESGNRSEGETMDAPDGDFKRVSYYDAASQEADGLVFLANKGDPAISGTFDYVWGNSLSYVSEDGSQCAASPTILKDGKIGDGDEVALYLDEECDDSCGAIRPGSVAYKGWKGANKVFLVKFSMPDTGTEGFNKNMPAAWILHASIARTGQYTDCSCWKGDLECPQAGSCGEADIFEVLESGSKKLTSTFHFADSLGTSDYFDRPVDKAITAAIVFQASSSMVSVKVLDDDFDFSSTLTPEQVDELMNDESESDTISMMSFGG